jgi:hypothetical protein
MEMRNMITKWALIKNDKKKTLTSVEIEFKEGEEINEENALKKVNKIIKLDENDELVGIYDTEGEARLVAERIKEIDKQIAMENAQKIMINLTQAFGALLALPFIAAEYYKQWLKFLHSQMDYYDVDKGKWVKRSLFSRIKEMFGGDKL